MSATNKAGILCYEHMIEILNLKDEPDQLPSLASWHHREWSCFNPAESLEERKRRMQPFFNDDFIPSTYIAKQGVLFGSAAIVAQDMDSKPSLTPWLASVYVQAEHRHKGIGRKLVSHVMAQAGAHGIRTLYLFTPDKQDFYLHLGWKIMCVEPYHGHEVTLMQATLTSE